MAESADREAAHLGLTDLELERRHLSELHQLAGVAGVPRFRTMRRAELVEAIRAAGVHMEEAPQPSIAALEQAPDDSYGFAIVEVDHGDEDSIPVTAQADRVTIKKIVSSEDQAERETQRLNAQASGASYFWQATRLELGPG
jgi:hypothetical protein